MTVIGDATRNTMIMFYLPKREINMKRNELGLVLWGGWGVCLSWNDGASC